MLTSEMRISVTHGSMTQPILMVQISTQPFYQAVIGVMRTSSMSNGRNSALSVKNTGSTDPRHEKVSAYAEAADAYGRISPLLRVQGKLPAPRASIIVAMSCVVVRTGLPFGPASERETGRGPFALPRLTRASPSKQWQDTVNVQVGCSFEPSHQCLRSQDFIWFSEAPESPVPISCPALVFPISSMLAEVTHYCSHSQSSPNRHHFLSAIEGGSGLTLEILFVPTFTRCLVGGTSSKPAHRPDPINKGHLARVLGT